MKTLKFKGTEVSLSFDSYQNNGSLAVLMNTVPDDEKERSGFCQYELYAFHKHA